MGRDWRQERRSSCARRPLHKFELIAEALGLRPHPQNGREHLPYLLSGAFLGINKETGYEWSL